METIAFPRILILVLLLSGTCTVMVPGANAQKRCQVVLDQSNCNLASCRRACSQQHGTKHPSGGCQGTGSVIVMYKCVCFYDC